MYLKQVFVEGSGHASYLISSDETQEAAVVDPGRDISVYADDAQREGLRIRYVLETHLLECRRVSDRPGTGSQQS